MPEINTTFNPLSYIALFLFSRSSSGVTMDGWTANVSWVWPEFCWRSWTSAQWWLAGTSFSLPPPWWTQRWRRWSATLPRCHWRAPSGRVVSDHKTHANTQRIGRDSEIYHTSISDFTDCRVDSTGIRRMYCILLIFYQAVSLSLTGDTFLLLLPLTAPQTRRKILPSSDLFDEKNKNLPNEDTSKEGSLSGIDPVVLGRQHTVGSAMLQRRAFLTAHIWFLFPGLLVVLLLSH